MVLSERIRAAMAAKGISQAELARAVGVKPPSIHGWLNGKAKFLRGENLLLAATALGVRQEWLATGVGPMTSGNQDAPAETPENREILGSFGNAPEDTGSNREKLLRIFAEIERTEQTKPPVAAQYQGIPGARPVHVVDEDSPGQYLIPRVTLRLQAGITGYQSDVDYRDGGTVGVSRTWVENKGYDPTRLISVDVKGESMEPTIYEGDTVVINLEETQPVDNCVYAVNYDGEAVIKRLSRDMGKWWLMSDNPDQRRYYRRACQGSECIIIGRVVRRIGDHL